MTTHELCDAVRQTAYDIQVHHGHGHLEQVYENALSVLNTPVHLGVVQASLSVLFAFFCG